MKKGIAFFDFDGTITTRDTLLEFIRFTKGNISFFRGFVINSPYLFAYKLKLISNQRAKEKVLQHFFGNTTWQQFETWCHQFASEKIPALLRPKALQTITELKASGIEVVIVSASPAYWISPWAKTLDIAVLGTQLENKGNLLTGKIEGKNCHGKEKVARIHQSFNLNEYQEIWAYGDTGGDKPMLALAKHAYYKPFL